MLKNDFLKKVKESLDLRSMDAAKEVVDKLSALVVELVKSGEEITLGEIGKFCIVEKAERKGRNPQTGEEITIPAKKAVKFKIASSFKHAVNE